MRLPICIGLLACGLLLTASVGPAEPTPQQPVEALRPETQQQVEIIRSGATQGVSGVDVAAQQEIGVPEPVTPAQRAASTAGKVVVGIVAVGVAAGMAVVSLFFL